MNSSELGTILEIPPRTIRDKTQKASENKQDSLKLNDRFFKFEMVKGHYVYEEIFAEVIDTSDTGLSAAWRRASKEQQEKASRRLAVVRLYRNRPPGESWKKFLERIAYKYRDVKPTRSKLFRWLERVRQCEEKGEVALEHLLDTRGKSNNNRSYTDAQYDFMTRLFLENPDRSLTKIHLYIEEEFGKGCLSYATVARMIKRYKEENILVATLAESPQAANNKLRPAPGNASEEATYNNALWEMDGTPVDVMCSDGIRYQLSAAIDVYSRRAIVVVVPTANTTSLAKVFKKGIAKLGVPEKVKLDNGKEYRSLSFEYTCARLKIEQQFTMPYSGWQKPHVERFFGTLTRDLFEELPGYIGHSVADRQRIADRETYEKKLQAKERAREVLKGGNAAAKKLAKKQKEMDAYIPTTLTRDALESYIDKWIKRYESRRHKGIHQTPLEKWNECAIPTQTISDERVLDVLVGLSEKKRITKKGVTWKKIGYWNDLFYDRVGESVWMLSDDELGFLYIYDLEMNFLCRAESAEHIGKSRAEYMASRFFDKKSKKIIRELNELRREAPERYKLLVEEQAEEAEEMSLALEMKSPLINNVRSALEQESAMSDEEIEEISEEGGETIVVNGRPIFSSVKDRFDWDLEHDMVDDTTQRLADKHEGLWELAVEEWEDKKAG